MAIRDNNFVLGDPTDGVFNVTDANNIKAETDNYIDTSSQTKSESDLFQMAKTGAVVASKGDFYKESVGSAADVYLLEADDDLADVWRLKNGMRFRFKVVNANTGASTVNINSLGAKDLKLNGGSALVGGELVVNQNVEMVFDETNDYFVLNLPAKESLTAKGDLLYNNGTSATRLPVGNQYDMLGVGASSVVGWEQNPQRRVVDLPNTDGAASDGGYRSGGVILDDGTLRCWGDAANGALGNGASPADRSTNFLTPAFPIGTTGKPIKWERQGQDNIVLMDNGDVWVWGRNAYGELGVGNTSNVLVPTKVTALNGVNIVDVQLSKGYYNTGSNYGNHTLFLVDDGSLYACGHNGQGQLGIGNTISQSTPQLLSKSDWVKIYAMGPAGGGFSAGIDTSGDLYMWGYNARGQLGIGSTTNQSTPQLVNAFGGVTVSKFSGAHGYGTTYVNYGSSMCLLSTGAVYTWGHNAEGQLGTGNTTQYNTPQHITGLGTDNQDILMAHSAYGVSYVIKDNQSIVASGYNGYGQLGDGTTTNKTTHQTIPNSLRSGRTIAQLKTLGTLTYTSTVILYDDGYIQACGYNDNGNYGIGTDLATNTSLQPVLGFMKHKPVQLCSIGRGSEASLGVLTEEGVYYQCGAGVAFQFPHYREGFNPVFDTMQPLYFS
jgi:alpha-tubulin suppressor-like RCC1 family protein